MSKTALVIGASRGLGLGLVKQLHEEGWRVIATVRDPQRAEPLAALGDVRIEALDIREASSVDALAQRLAGTQLDLLFINAGISGPRDATPGTAGQQDVSDIFMTNAVAPVRLAERLLSLMEPSKGVIAFMSSIMGSVTLGPEMGMPLYGASKAALNHLTRNFVASLGEETGLTVISMHPGWVRTDMGGDQAPLDVETSCRGMVEQVTKAAGQREHRFINYLGQPLLW